MKKEFNLPQLVEAHAAVENLRFCPLVSDATSTTLTKNMKAFKIAIDHQQSLVTAVYDRYKDIIAEEQPDVDEDKRTMTNKQITAMHEEANNVALEMFEVDVIYLKRTEFTATPGSYGVRKRNVQQQDGSNRVVESNYYDNYVVLRDELILSKEDYDNLHGDEAQGKKAKKGPKSMAIAE